MLKKEISKPKIAKQLKEREDLSLQRSKKRI